MPRAWQPGRVVRHRRVPARTAPGTWRSPRRRGAGLRLVLRGCRRVDVVDEVGVGGLQRGVLGGPGQVGVGDVLAALIVEPGVRRAGCGRSVAVWARSPPAVPAADRRRAVPRAGVAAGGLVFAAVGRLVQQGGSRTGCGRRGWKETVERSGPGLAASVRCSHRRRCVWWPARQGPEVVGEQVPQCFPDGHGLGIGVGCDLWIEPDEVALPAGSVVDEGVDPAAFWSTGRPVPGAPATTGVRAGWKRSKASGSASK
ncbi:hypothetical protein SCHAM137S_06541 [Streptomyces chartreusis]